MIASIVDSVMSYLDRGRQGMQEEMAKKIEESLQFFLPPN
jgi:hypothetical protein